MYYTAVLCLLCPAAMVLALQVAAVTLTVHIGNRKLLIQLWNNKLAVESPPELGILLSAPGWAALPVEPSLFFLIAVELSEPFKDWIDGMWNLIANKLRLLVNLTTPLEDGICRLHCNIYFCVRLSAEILYICVFLFLYLSRYIWYVGGYKIFSALVWVDRLITHEWAIPVFLNKWQ